MKGLCCINESLLPNFVRKKLYLFSFFFFFISSLFAKEYFVANNGNDSADGSINNPWRTLEKVNLMMSKFVSGDIIAFRGGDRFDGELIVKGVSTENGNPVIFTSYGIGQAIIFGGEAQNDWTNEGNGIWSSPCSENVFNVMKGDIVLQNARLPSIVEDTDPESNYYKVTTVVNKLNTFISDDLIGKPNLVGANISILTLGWILETRKISAFNSATGQVTVEKDFNYYIRADGGYFYVINGLNIITNNNDWYKDVTNNKLYIKSTSQPVDIFTNKNSNKKGVFVISDNISIINLSIKLFSEYGIHTAGNGGYDFSENQIKAIYKEGISVYPGTRVKISNNSISDISEIGIRSFAANSLIENNTITKVSYMGSLSYKPTVASNAIYSQGEGNIIRGNYIFKIGYAGINIEKGNVLVEKNYIEDYGLTWHDGGAIYAYNGEYPNVGSSLQYSTVQNNIIISSKNFTSKWVMHGIYMDNNVMDATIKNNSIAYCQMGIFFNGDTRRLLARNNNIYDVKHCGIKLAVGVNVTISSDANEAINNYVFIKDKKGVGLASSGKDDFNRYVNTDFNKLWNIYSYSNILLKTPTYYGKEGSNYNKYLSLDDWRLLTNNDTNSTENDSLWNDYKIESVLSDNLISNSDFETNINSWIVQGGTKFMISETTNSMKCEGNNTNTMYVRSNQMELEAGKNYLIEFDANVDKTSDFIIRVMNNVPPYKTIYQETNIFKKGWTNYSMIFTSSANYKNVEFALISLPNQPAISLDNVSLEKVTLLPTEERDKFFYNPTNSIKSFTLDNGTWKDLEGKTYQGSVTLEPFNSIILIKSEKSISVINASAGEDTSICKGETTILEASGGTSYEWSTGETTQSISVTPDKTTTYPVTVTEGTESATDEVIVTVNEVSANAGADKTITQGNTVALTATGGDIYLWSTGETTETIIVNPTITTTYSVTATIGSCNDTDDVKVTVKPSTGGTPVTADAGENQTICLGENVTLTASGGSAYSWNTGANTKSITVNPNSTITYTVTVTDGSESDTDQVMVTVNTVTTNAGEDQTITEGETASLTATGGDSYVWNTGETTATILVNPNTTTTYTVTAKKGSCEDTDDVKVNVQLIVDSGLLPANTDAGEDMTICLGQRVTLNGSGGDSYLWSSGETTSEVSVSPIRTTTYTLEATRGGVTGMDMVTITVENCQGREIEDDNVITIDLTVYPNPTDGLLYIEASHVKDDYHLIINDYKGSIIYTDQLRTSTSNNISREIDLSHYTKGVYFLRLINLEEQLVKKIVIR